MLHLVTLVLLVLLAWSVLGVGAALLLGVWLHHAGDAPSGPSQPWGQVLRHGTGRLLARPALSERTARDQGRRRRHG